MFYWHDTPWMWLSMVVFWSAFIVFAVYAVRGMSRRSAAQSGPRAAEILEARFARGEITSEEFTERREALDTADAEKSVRQQ